jgi:putative endonuclease
MFMVSQSFYVYILTNWEKTVLYVGVTNNMTRRLNEHFSGSVPGFTRQYSCKYLIYYEQYQYINDAIHREKELKGWKREKKEKLIYGYNPGWAFLNERFMRIKLIR